MTTDESQFCICLHKHQGVIQSSSSLYLVPKVPDPISFPEACHPRPRVNSLRAQKFVLISITQNQEKIKLRRIRLFFVLDDTPTEHDASTEPQSGDAHLSGWAWTGSGSHNHSKAELFHSKRQKEKCSQSFKPCCTGTASRDWVRVTLCLLLVFGSTSLPGTCGELSAEILSYSRNWSMEPMPRNTWTSV